MKPAWDRLMGDFEGKADALVADVDCTAEGKPPSGVPQKAPRGAAI